MQRQCDARGTILAETGGMEERIQGGATSSCTRSLTEVTVSPVTRAEAFPGLCAMQSGCFEATHLIFRVD